MSSASAVPVAGPAGSAQQLLGRLSAAAGKLKPGRGTELDAIRYPDGFISAVTTARYLEGKRDLLIVGDSGARDAPYLASLGKRVTQLDIAPQPNIENLVVQSIEERTPFDDASFDGVVLNEVLEHLYLDVAALEEIHRVLKPDGVLVITLPYSRRQDRPEYHVRIHTPRTLHRLLKVAGFEVEEEFERGIATRIPQFGLVARGPILAAQILLSTLGGRSQRDAVFATNRPFERSERVIGSNRVLRYLQRLPITYGVALKARPTLPADRLSVQISTFEYQNVPPRLVH